ncbi:MAG: PP2C family protein-serine/threonine phosphatase [Planctomycetota bacterium]|jgi:phosphoserine phosphatase
MVDQHEKLGRDVLPRMLEVAQLLSASASLTDVLSVIINAMRDTLDAERATVLECDPVRDELFSTVAHGLHRAGSAPASPGDRPAPETTGPDEIRFPADSGLAGQCAQCRRIINVPDAYADDRFNPEIDKLTGFRTRSILTVPLQAPDGRLIGVAQVLNKRQGTFDARDEQVARALASLAAVAIKRSRLIEDHIVREKLERDLHLARRIQQSTFPDRLPTVAGFGIDAWSEPAEETGGDAYDVIGCRAPATPRPVSDPAADRAVLLLADASGHGVGPALSVTQVRAMLRMAVRLGGASAAGAGEELPRIARHMNQQLCDDLPAGQFVTAWLGELNANDHTLRSVSAGQAPLVRYDATRDTFEAVEADTTPLGVIRDLDITIAQSIPMGLGDIFAVFSDGIFEAQDRSGGQFGTDRVIEVLAAHRGASSTRMLGALRDAVAAFTGPRPADDDRTAIIIKRMES